MLLAGDCTYRLPAAPYMALCGDRRVVTDVSLRGAQGILESQGH